jgi:hypothetical protein
MLYPIHISLHINTKAVFKFKGVHPVVYINILYDLVPSKHNLYNV